MKKTSELLAVKACDSTENTRGTALDRTGSEKENHEEIISYALFFTRATLGEILQRPLHDKNVVNLISWRRLNYTIILRSFYH